MPDRREAPISLARRASEGFAVTCSLACASGWYAKAKWRRPSNLQRRPTGSTPGRCRKRRKSPTHPALARREPPTTRGWTFRPRAQRGRGRRPWWVVLVSSSCSVGHDVRLRVSHLPQACRSSSASHVAESAISHTAFGRSSSAKREITSRTAGPYGVLDRIIRVHSTLAGPDGYFPRIAAFFLHSEQRDFPINVGFGEARGARPSDN